MKEINHKIPFCQSCDIPRMNLKTLVQMQIAIKTKSIALIASKREILPCRMQLLVK